ncbi:MAG: hypothetical protein R3E58_01860 [Phycisphaerae bacterium]|nr:hypothetical protein [Phycisphaerales bacterium]
MSTAKSLGLIVLFSMALVGCQANGRAVSMTTSGDAKMVVCPQCEVIWVEGLDSDDPYNWTYKEEQIMKCAGCRSAVENFFKTGKLVGSQCESCGGNLKQCSRIGYE